MRRDLVVAALLTTVAAAGCSGGSSSSSRATSSQAPAASASSSTSAADRSIADQINLRQADFPGGWQTQPNPVTSAENTNGQRALYACLNMPPPQPHTTATVNSPNFVVSQEQASSNVQISRTAGQSLADYRVLASPAFPDCARKVVIGSLSGTLPPGSSVGSSSARGIPTTAPAGEEAAASVVTVNVAGPGNRGTIYAEFLLIHRGRALVAVQTIGLGQPFPTGLQQSIVADVENRASQVLA